MSETSLWRHFSCDASTCVNTCCAGWRIPFIQQDRERIRSLPQEAQQDILANIHLPEEAIAIKNERCSFLTGENLCRIILDYGEAYLGTVCVVFPRQVNRLGRYAERSVRSSCPHVVMEVLGSERISILAGAQDDVETDFLPFRKLRDFLIAALQSMDGAMAGKVWILLEFVKDVEGLLPCRALSLEMADKMIREYAGQYSSILTECAKDTSDKERVEEAFLFFAHQLRSAIHQKKALKYAPSLWSDVDRWQDDRRGLRTDMNRLSDLLRECGPLFSENYLTNEVFLNWKNPSQGYFCEDLYSSLAKWMIFYVIMLSAVRNGNLIEKVWLSRMVSDMDRDYTHNDEARHKMGAAIAKARDHVQHKPWLFPFW